VSFGTAPSLSGITLVTLACIHKIDTAGRRRHCLLFWLPFFCLLLFFYVSDYFLVSFGISPVHVFVMMQNVNVKNEPGLQHVIAFAGLVSAGCCFRNACGDAKGANLGRKENHGGF
jgi:hypothetical protein